ncbi:hypothetical protein KXS07_04100 [Inquilinus limosus]|uniref:hypothetical protein n=1 Tax=Inquilinus limosus TaxID=171674 RepID=UPI0004083586|nr:hypothetical protein [Inquilinus limosus]
MATRNLERDIDALTRTLAELRSEMGVLAGDAARDAVDAGRRGARYVGTAANAATEGIQDQVAERPLTSIGLAFAAGLAIGRFLVR